jgi:hypothetical protein
MLACAFVGGVTGGGGYGYAGRSAQEIHQDMSYWLNAAHAGMHGPPGSAHMPPQVETSPDSLAWAKGPWGPGAIASPSTPGSPASPDAVARSSLPPLPLPTQLPSPPEQQPPYVRGGAGTGSGRTTDGGTGAPRLLPPHTPTPAGLRARAEPLDRTGQTTFQNCRDDSLFGRFTRTPLPILLRSRGALGEAVGLAGWPYPF